MITIGTRRKGEVELVSGLQVGQMIVAHGKDKVHTGSKVNIIAVLEDGVSIQDILSGNKTL